MQVRVGKRIEGESNYLVVAGRKRHLAPILVRGTDREKVKAELARVIREVKGDPVEPGPG